MRVKVIVAVVASGFGFLAESAVTPKVNQPRERGGIYSEHEGIYKRQHGGLHGSVRQMDWWNYANGTTQGATADGKIGVIIEPDIIEGVPGVDGGVVIKARLGPYTVDSGASQTYPISFSPPCSDCYITAIQLGLEYPNGRIANVDTGAWCHHIDLNLMGQTDYTCPSSMESLLAAADPAMGGRRIFSAGNERVPMRLNSRRRYGIDPGDSQFGGVMEIMNENKRAITVYMTLSFEYVPKSTPGYRAAELAWVDVTNCERSSDFEARNGKYVLESQEFEVKENSYLLTGIGHQHDGGQMVELYVNGVLSCVSKQMYGNRRGGWIEPLDGTIIESMVMPPGSHISDVGVCKDWGELRAGDRIKALAYYDDQRHMQMRDTNGELEKQMGIMWAWIGPKASVNDNYGYGED